MEQKTFFTTLKDFIIKFWYVFPILYALFAFALILMINMNSLPAVIEDSVGILLLIVACQQEMVAVHHLSCGFYCVRWSLRLLSHICRHVSSYHIRQGSSDT